MITLAFLSFLMPVLASKIDIDVAMPDGQKATAGQVKSEPFLDIFCVEDGFRPRKLPGKPELSGAKPLTFGEGLRWVEYHQAADGVYYLVCKGGIYEPTTVLGWVPESALLLGNMPQTTGSQKQHEIHKIPQNRGTGVIRKAMIINSKEWVKENNSPNGNKLTDIVQPIRHLGLDDSAPTASPIKFFNILFVYKIDTKKKMVLLGFSANASYRNSQLAGWISDKAVCFWDSREAIQWKFDNKNDKSGLKIRETKAYAFATLSDAQKYMSSFKNRIRIPDGSMGAQIPDPKSIVAEEALDKNGNSEPWDFDAVRFPVISKPSEQLDTVSNWGRFVEIGVIGNFKIEGGGLVSTKELEKNNKTIEKIKQEVKQNYIMFVLDNTGSMEKVFQNAIPEYINLFVNEKGLDASEKSQINIAVTFYNDFASRLEKDKPGANLDQTIEQVSDWMSIDSPQGKDLVAKLANTKAKDGGDALEQPIHGIKKSLINAMKSGMAPPPFAFKRCVVLGDMGNHEKDNLGQDLHKEIEFIADLLVPLNATAWDFVPIQVPNPRGVNGQRDPDYDLFSMQMAEIAKMRRQRLEKSGKKINDQVRQGESVVYSDYEELTKYLAERTRQYRQEAVKDFDNLVDLRRGVTTQLSDNLKDIFKKEGLNIDVYTKNGYQFYEKAWITTHDGTHREGREPMPQIDIKTLVREDEFRALEGLVKKFDCLDFEEIAEDIFNLVVSGKLGEKINDEFMKNVVGKLGGLNFKTPLLSYIIDAKYNMKKSDLTGIQAKERFADLLSRILLLKPIYNEIRNEERYKNGYIPSQRELPGGQKYTVWSGNGDKLKDETTRRKFLLSGEQSLNAGDDNFYYWFDDAKEIP